MAVAIKKLGYDNIRLYNGGLKDWVKAGYTVDVQDPLPEYEGRYIESQDFLALIKQADVQECMDEEGKPLFTLLDYRTELAQGKNLDLPIIKTNCPQLVMLLDDFADPIHQKSIPMDGLVVLVCETGNRDPFAMRFLKSFGYDNVVGLRFGMRAWIKAGYPVEVDNPSQIK